MITLKVDNSICSVVGLTVERFRQLRKVLSYTEATRSAFHKGYHATTRYLMDKRGTFPTGLLYLVQEFLKNDPVVLNDVRIRPPLNSIGQETLFRKKALEPYLEQSEAATAALKHSRGIIVAPTGVGKSLIAALICDAFRVPSLIVVPSLELKAQTTSSLQNMFGRELVGPMGKNGKRQFFITVENVDALNPNKVLDDVDLVIIDEFHHSGAKTYRELNRKAWSGVYYKIGLTATPFRSQDTEKLLLESVLSKVIYRVEYHAAVQKKYIVPMEVYYYDLPVTKIKGNAKSYPGVYSELVVNNEYRNKLITHLLTNLNEAGCSTLCLVKHVEHGRKLAGPFAYAKGENDNNREIILEFGLRRHNVLIGTVGVLGEGVDTKPAEYIILAGGGKSKNQMMQNFGRGFRVYPDKESCKIIMFRDASHKWMVDHFNACKRHIKAEYGTAPIKLSLPEGL